MIKLIACMDKNRGIGKDNAMPWHLPKELAYFKEITENNIVVMGRKTYESIGKPLPNRVNIVISSTQDISNDSTLTFPSIDNFMSFLDAYKLVDIMTGEGLDIYIIGGATIYEQFLPYADELYITTINAEFDCDTFFPEFSSEWTPFIESAVPIVDNGYELHFARYIKE
jgi:dihydrofolate reductase